MTKKLVWRLGKLPSVEELQSLVKDKIITQEEARDILFNEESEEERDKKSLEKEIKFLRELSERLSQREKIVEVIREIQMPYYKNPWYRPYDVWCSGTITANAGLVSMNATATPGNSTLTMASNSFVDIETF